MGDVYYTYYADFPAQIFSSSWYNKTYSDFPSGYFDSKYYNNNTYNLYAGKLKSPTELAYIGNLKTESDVSKFQSTVKTKLVQYAKAGHLYTSSSATAYNSTSKYNNSAGWFVSIDPPGGSANTSSSICYHLLNAINAGTFTKTLNTKQFTYPYEDGSGDYPVYVAPIVSSAACNWNEYVTENVPYSTCVKDEVNNKVYCCKDSSITPVLRNGSYQCGISTTVTKFQYDYTINYYKK